MAEHIVGHLVGPVGGKVEWWNKEAKHGFVRIDRALHGDAFIKVANKDVYIDYGSLLTERDLIRSFFMPWRAESISHKWMYTLEAGDSVSLSYQTVTPSWFDRLCGIRTVRYVGLNVNLVGRA